MDRKELKEMLVDIPTKLCRTISLTIVSGILVPPIAIIHAFLRWIIGLPNTRFDKNPA